MYVNESIADSFGLTYVRPTKQRAIPRLKNIAAPSWDMVLHQPLNLENERSKLQNISRRLSLEYYLPGKDKSLGRNRWQEIFLPITESLE